MNNVTQKPTTLTFISTVKFSTPEGTIEEVKKRFQDSKVIHMVGIPDTLDKKAYFEKLADSMGKYYDVNEDLESGSIQKGRWIDITYDPKVPDRYRSSNTRQPLHTDASYYPIENNMQYFFCAGNASMGGATTFIDTKELVRAMEMDGQQELLERMQNIPVVFSKFERNKTRPILIKEGNDWRINYNYYCIDKNNTEEAKQVCKDFFDFLENRIQPSGIFTPVHLKVGEAVFFNDERVLHGRNAFFAAKPGERSLIKGTIVEWN